MVAPFVPHKQSNKSGRCFDFNITDHVCSIVDCFRCNKYLLYIYAVVLDDVNSHFCSRDAANIDGLGHSRIEDLFQVDCPQRMNLCKIYCLLM